MTDLSLAKSKPVEIVAILDRSGSMQSILTDAIGGFNAFIDQQKTVEGEANITIALFDDRYEKIQESAPLSEALILDTKNFVPRGSTGLYDAIGKTVSTLKERRLKGGVDGAIIAILTDGWENASREYTQAQVKELVEGCEKEFNWQFIYLAANQDAFAVGATLGVKGANAVTFAASGAGVRSATSQLGDYTTNYRSSYANARPLIPDADKDAGKSE